MHEAVAEAHVAVDREELNFLCVVEIEVVVVADRSVVIPPLIHEGCSTAIARMKSRCLKSISPLCTAPE